MMSFESNGEWKRIVREWLGSTMPYVNESLLGNFLSVTGKYRLTIKGNQEHFGSENIKRTPRRVLLGVLRLKQAYS
jgi:hypothetical protein